MATRSRIDKDALLAKLRADLEEAVAVMEKAASTAHDAATHPEMKPENDKDTRGIEAGYLAGAQSQRAVAMRRTLNEIKALKPRVFGKGDAVDVTALVELQDANDEDKPRVHAFIAPHGGLKVKMGAVEVQIVTPSSPLGDAVVGKKLGDIVELHAGGKVRELEIVGLS